MYCALRNYRRFAVALALLLVVGFPQKAHGQNFPPVAKATPLSEEVFLGQALAFSSAESIDPDEFRRRQSNLTPK